MCIRDRYLHGGIRDVESPRSILSNAAVHSGARYVILQDIKNFYPSILINQVDALYRGLFGFGAPVSALLSSICCREGSTPQGASTSGYIANLIFWDVEPKVVTGLLARGFRYSRFADDITISSGWQPSSDELSFIVASVTGMLATKGCHQKRTKLHMRVRGQGVKESDNCFKPLTVTGLSVFNSVPGLTKIERKRIRSAVRQLEVMSETVHDWTILEPMYQRAMGRVGRLLACRHPDGQVLKARLNSVKRMQQVPLLQRYQQALGGGLVGCMRDDTPISSLLGVSQSEESQDPLPGSK